MMTCHNLLMGKQREMLNDNESNWMEVSSKSLRESILCQALFHIFINEDLAGIHKDITQMSPKKLVT